MEAQFKVYATLAKNSEPEVRRFGMDRGALPNYHYLTAKLEDVFPVLRGNQYTVGWQDEDGDEIRITSNEELLMALNSSVEEVKKLYVRRVCSNDKDDKTNIDELYSAPAVSAGWCGIEPGLHVGVVCDGCEGAVVGFRYRCTVCRDFDLCQCCEAARVHPEHCMLRIPAPNIKVRQTMQHVKSKIKHGRRVRGMFSEKHCTDKCAEGTEEAECPYKSCERRRRVRGSWIDTVVTYMNEFANLAGDVASQAQPSASASAPACQPCTNAENGETTIPEATAPPCASSSSDTKRGEAAAPPTIQLDKLFGPDNMKYVLEIQKTLAMMLQAPNSCNDDTASQASSQNSSQAPSQVPSVECQCPEPERPEPERQASTPERAEGWTMVNNESDVVDMPAPQPKAQQPSAPQPSAPQPSAQPKTHKKEPSLYPNIGKAKADVADDCSCSLDPVPAPTQQRVSPKKPAKPAPRVPHPKPHVEEAVLQMLAMGYTDEGGWLTQLVECTNGNISSVLDMLNPVPVRKP